LGELLSGAIAQAWDSFVPLMHWRLLPLSTYAFQPWILADEQSALLTRIAWTVNALLCADEKLTVFSRTGSGGSVWKLNASRSARAGKAVNNCELIVAPRAHGFKEP